MVGAVLTTLLLLGPTEAPPREALPSTLTTLVERARLEGRIVAWCRAELRPGHPGAFAVAVSSGGSRGRYVALDTDGRVAELGTFDGSAEVQCHTRADAEKLDRSIRESEGIAGNITPRWNTTVVCVFVDSTDAACWQLSLADNAFVRVGGWIT